MYIWYILQYYRPIIYCNRKLDDNIVQYVSDIHWNIIMLFLDIYSFYCLWLRTKYLVLFLLCSDHNVKNIQSGTLRFYLWHCWHFFRSKRLYSHGREALARCTLHSALNNEYIEWDAEFIFGFIQYISSIENLTTLMFPRTINANVIRYSYL